MDSEPSILSINFSKRWAAAPFEVSNSYLSQVSIASSTNSFGSFSNINISFSPVARIGMQISIIIWDLNSMKNLKKAGLSIAAAK